MTQSEFDPEIAHHMADEDELPNYGSIVDMKAELLNIEALRHTNFDISFFVRMNPTCATVFRPR